jgi:dCTP deaminase
MASKQSTLSDKAILRYIENGEIVIYPFNINHLGTSSYDVTLGEYYFREQPLDHGSIYNIYSKEIVNKVWGNPYKAEPYNSGKHDVFLENIDPDEKIIFIGPGETILAHTTEFIGGRTTVTTMMKARSSMGRNFINVCSCAGWGDVGYFNRYTMEIKNNSKLHTIPLIVGRRIAQIIFFDTEGIIDKSYNDGGKYQTSNDLETLKKNWNPYDMIPKLYLEKSKTERSNEVD